MTIKQLVLLCTLISGHLVAQEITTKPQDTLKPIPLKNVLITGQKITDPVLSSATTALLKKVVQPKNVADLFNDFNGFSLIKRGNYAIDPSFRGSQYEQLNIQFDGGTKAMHACPNRMDPITTHVVPEEIEQIEVIKGPYTVRYGATFGGVVNLVTQHPNTMDKGLHGNFKSGYETNGNSYVSSLTLQQVTNSYDISANAGYRDFGNYKDGNDTQIPSSFRSLDYGIRLGVAVGSNQRVQAHWRQSYGRDVLHAGLPMDTEEDNSTIVSIDYTFSNVSKIIKQVHAKAYYSYVDHLMSNQRRPSFTTTQAISAIDATTTGGKVEFKLKPTNIWTLYSGLDATLIARDGGRTRMVKKNMMGMELPQPLIFRDKVWQDSYINDYGVFAENKVALSNKTLLTAGARYDLVVSETQDPESDFSELYNNLDQRKEHNISATLSVKQQLSNHSNIEIAYGRGVRSANMTERYINHFTVGQDPFEYVGNATLAAEVNNQFEIGFKGHLRFLQDIKGLHYNLSGYYARYENYILPVVDPTLDRKFMPDALPQEVKRFINIDNAYKTGFEAEAAVYFASYFNFTSAVSYVYTKNKDVNESLPLTPPLTTRLQAGFEKENLWANIAYTIASKQDRISTSFREIETAAYQTLDIKMGYKPTNNITIGLAVLNLFDKAYNDHLNFAFVNQENFSREPINNPGRNISGFLQFGF